MEDGFPAIRVISLPPLRLLGVGDGIDTSFGGGFPTVAGGLGNHSASWIPKAACRGGDAPGMFADRWGIGRDARRHRAAALATCRKCPVRRECGLAALADVDAGLSLYGVLCGVEFTDVTPSRQQRDVARLRAVVTRLGEAGITAVSTRDEPYPDTKAERPPLLVVAGRTRPDAIGRPITALPDTSEGAVGTVA